MTTYKIQVQEDEIHTDLWRDVKNEHGVLLTFENEIIARAKLEQLYPVLVKLEKYASGSKRTRVLVMNPYQDKDDNWKKR